MSTFQQITKWALRALLVWGAIEAGASAYDWGAARFDQLARLNGHHAAMTRLAEQAERQEAQLQAQRAATAHAQAGALPITPSANETPDQAAARLLREALMEVGAQAPVVDIVEAQAAPAAPHVFTARWREAASPQVIMSLSQRLPDLIVTRLRLERSEPASAELTFTAALAPQPSPHGARP